MKRLSLVVFLAVLLTGAAHAQPVAEVLEKEAKFTLISPSEARYEVHQRVRVNKQGGAEAGTFLVYTDEFRSLSSFSGRISSGGKVIRKLKKDDLYVSLESDALVDKSYVNTYEPVAPYPFEVEYNYTVTYRKAIASFPSFTPMVDYDVPVRHASYTVSVPLSTEIRFKASAEPAVSQEDDRKVFRWEFAELPAVTHENYMPSLLELTPYVHACPVEFRFAGTSGTQNDWTEVGRWLYSLRPANPEVPAGVRQEIADLTKDCSSDLEKIRAVYDFLRQHTRYISIQLGIGGFAPTAPERVAASGFGDCKALSFYMQQLLALLDIRSEYVIVNTKRAKLYDGYASVGQMNHAILCVPMQRDTLWVECTNPSVPLGYRHEDIAGHEAVLIRYDGGKLTRIPAYPDSLSVEADRTEVRLSADGSARVSVERMARLDCAERFFDFAELKAEDARKFLLSGVQGHPENFRVESFSENFRDYDGTPGYCPEARVRFSFGLDGIGRVDGDRMFVRAFPFRVSMNAQKTTRKYDMVVNRAATARDSVLVVVPEGYAVEHLPEGRTLSCSVADFRQEFRLVEEGVLVVNEIKMKPGRMPASGYPEYRELVKSVNKAYESALVLKKNP